MAASNKSVLALELSLVKLRNVHSELLTVFRARQREAEGGICPPEVLSDFTLLLRDIVETADDLKKEANALMELTGDVAALQWTLQATNTKGLDPIRGELSVGSVSQKVFPRLPSKSKEPERHQRLMEGLGLQVGGDSGIFSISWPRLVEKLSADYAAGKPLPDGIRAEDLQMKPKLTVRRAAAK